MDTKMWRLLYDALNFIMNISGGWCLLWKCDWLYACSCWFCWTTFARWQTIHSSHGNNRGMLGGQHKQRLSSFRGNPTFVSFQRIVSGLSRYPCGSFGWAPTYDAEENKLAYLQGGWDFYEYFKYSMCIWCMCFC